MKDPRVATLEGLYLAGDPDVQLMIRAVIEKEGVDLNGLAPETLDDLIEMCGVMVEQLPDALNERFTIPGMPERRADADPNPETPVQPLPPRLA